MKVCYVSLSGLESEAYGHHKLSLSSDLGNPWLCCSLLSVDYKKCSMYTHYWRRKQVLGLVFKREILQIKVLGSYMKWKCQNPKSNHRIFCLQFHCCVCVVHMCLV